MAQIGKKLFAVDADAADVGPVDAGVEASYNLQTAGVKWNRQLEHQPDSCQSAWQSWVIE